MEDQEAAESKEAVEESRASSDAAARTESGAGQRDGSARQGGEESPHSPAGAPPLARRAAALADACNECMACVSRCAFLRERGTPRSLFAMYEERGAALRELAYECSLCGLCAAMCPHDLDPGAMFLELRREAVALGEARLKRYATILNFERRGNSRLFTYYGLPEGCDTVLFPGCNMPGSRPDVTWDMFRYLRHHIPTLGVALDCCNKPSRDLGREAYFQAMFGRLRGFLLDHGVRNVLVACPNCFKVFHEHGDGLNVRTAYQEIAERGAPLPEAEREALHELAAARGPVITHDPCPLRGQAEARDAVRRLAVEYGLKLEEARHKGKRASCCGEGGSVGFHAPALAREWGKLRAQEAAGRPVLTYCAGCVGFLKKHVDVFHLLDLLFRPRQTLEKGPRVIQTPFTYFQRLRLKRRLKRELFSGDPASGHSAPAASMARRKTR